MVETTITKLQEDWFKPGKCTKIKDILEDIYNKIEILDERTRVTA